MLSGWTTCCGRKSQLPGKPCAICGHMTHTHRVPPMKKKTLKRKTPTRKRRTPDKYSLAIAHFKKNPGQIRDAWSDLHHPHFCLFQVLTPDGRAHHGIDLPDGRRYGCPTQVRCSPDMRCSPSTKLDIKIRALPDFPSLSTDIEVRHLPAFARIQREADRLFRNKKTKKRLTSR